VNHKPDLELGDGHSLRFTCWDPDLDLNPHYAGLEELIREHGARYGAIVSHLTPDGKLCEGGIIFDTPLTEANGDNTPKWTVESWDPLTLSPSLLCQCGDHGYIRDGKWVRV
jgi:hypothetical protein